MVNQQPGRRLGAQPEIAPIHAGASSHTPTDVGKSAATSTNELVALIKSKKELQSLDDAFVREKVEKCLRADNRIAKKLAELPFNTFRRSKECETLLKAVRKELRAVYGVFQQGNRDLLLDGLRTAAPAQRGAIIDEILATHTSTRERLPHYDAFWRALSQRIPAPKKLLDLGCGLNPLSYGTMSAAGWRPLVIASDIGDMTFLRDAARVLGIPLAVEQRDLVRDHAQLPEADVTLLLKLLDSLEEAKRHVSYPIIDAVKSPWIVVSFPTQSLGGKKRIAAAGRTWFERLLTRKELRWETFTLPNELVYVIER